MDTSRANIARILQNMIEEAEENITAAANIDRVAAGFSYMGPHPRIVKRREELKEAMELVSALNDSD
jgi:hypothetical protein